MRRVLNRPGLLLLGVLLAVGGMAIYAAGLPGTAGSSHDGPPPSVWDSGDPERAHRTYHYTMETIVNYDARGSAPLPHLPEQLHLRSERWVEIGPDGVANRYLTRTFAEDGGIWQEQHFDGTTLVLNHHARPVDGATCSERGAHTPRGTTMSLIEEDELRAIGFELSNDPPEGVHEHVATLTQPVKVFSRQGRSGSPDQGDDRVSFIVLDANSGQSMGQWNYRILPTGRLLLLDAQSISTISEISADDSLFAFEALPPCDEQMRPDVAPEDRSDETPGSQAPPEIATPTPAVPPGG